MYPLRKHVSVMTMVARLLIYFSALLPVFCIMPPKGGIKQQLAALREQKKKTADSVDASDVGKYNDSFDKQKRTQETHDSRMVDRFKSGKCSAVDLQVEAEAVTTQYGDASSSNAVEFSQLGSSGKHKGNCSRDVTRKLRKKSRRIPLYSCKRHFLECC